MSDQDDKALVAKAVWGDSRAFEDLLGRHYDMMFRISFKWCGNRPDAEDITQEACIKLARVLASFRGESTFTTWLYRLVINTAKDWQRAQKRHRAMDDGLDQAQSSGSQEDQVYAQEVLTQIRDLPEGEKDALLLVFGEGLSHAEAAVICGCKESTISWRIHEARKKLGEKLKEKKYG